MNRHFALRIGRTDQRDRLTQGPVSPRRLHLLQLVADDLSLGHAGLGRRVREPAASSLVRRTVMV